MKLSNGSTKRGVLESSAAGAVSWSGVEKTGTGDDGGWSEGQDGSRGLVAAQEYRLRFSSNYRESETDMEE